MALFSIIDVIDPETNPFDRQERISWLAQDRIRNAKVMVVGAGAIGNETLKNLVLLGFENILVCDFDTIALSNLSRTVLFRSADVGRRKAEVAAERAAELALSKNLKIDWFHGDIVWELGLGVFRMMDVVLGCLDNVEARLAVNRFCRFSGTPWIDAGINELAGHVSVFSGVEGPCYRCGTTREQRVAARRRYSCPYGVMKSLISDSRVPTVQISAAIVAALQVQEAVKLICNYNPSYGKKIYFQGTVNDFDLFPIEENPDCREHSRFPEVLPLGVSTNVTLRTFLDILSRLEDVGPNAILDLSWDRSFVVSTGCRRCGKRLIHLKPGFRLSDRDLYCSEHLDAYSKEGRAALTAFARDEQPTEKQEIAEFSLTSLDDNILDLTLADIGVPRMHIVSIRNAHGTKRYYELQGDQAQLLPALCG